MVDLSLIQRYLHEHTLSGWLLHDFHHTNPIFWEVIGLDAHVTRPTFLLVPASGRPTLVVHQVDAGRFYGLDITILSYLGRADMQRKMADLLQVGQTLAMEYSPLCALPAVSHVDAGTFELIQSFGVTVVSSADLVQYAVGRLDASQTAQHLSAARKLDRIVQDAFGFISDALANKVTELDVCAFIRRRLTEENLVTDSGPTTSVNRHSADPHYEPASTTASLIRPGDWVLIDLWAREQLESAVYADITWVGFVGSRAPEAHLRAFEIVARARDLALEHLQEAFQRGETVEGRQMDEVARSYITTQGFGDYFTHRLGHSLGKTVHSYAVNLDSFETWDSRPIIPGIAFTIEPGVYLSDFGVRSEIDVLMTDQGPVVTTPAQKQIVLIG